MDQIHIAVAVGKLYIEAEEEAAQLRRNIRFRLSRNSLNMLVQLLPRQKSHGWSHEMEVLVTVYWLACGASYRVTADVLAIPLATICQIVHNVVEEMMTIIRRVIHFPKPEEMEEVGAGFARLAGHEAFRCAAGVRVL
ncbi:uncharacterized protein ACO6RY_11939 [Pungitius sinensis]